ncbi:TPA: ead/Ea22-like family protein [Escherichia coli]|nr:ead/Ea22-like family protein [Escherichia coli]HDV1416943.1 ead/Ea22-like family protein [Escherichia coli]
MTKINYQVLREAAEKATWGDWDSYKPHRGARGYEVRLSSQAIAQHVLKNNAEFIAAFNPKVALALLDERERNQQYIKRRDQENEDIALTVGRLLIENGQLVADTLRHLADNEIDSDYFAITSTNENGTEIDHEMAITDYALQAAGTVDELVAALESAEKRIAELKAEPVSQTYKLNQLSGNSPVTQDSWISCSERMPVIGELNWRTSFPLLITCEIGVMPAYYGFVSVNGDRHYGFMESLKYGDDSGNHPQTNEYGLISNVTHWMPLPEPPL